jgi:hypothetical protein
MMSILRIAVVVFGAGFLLLGLLASLGPGFPIAEALPRPVSELYLQATLAATYGVALILAGVGSRFKPLMKRCLTSALVLTPFLLWAMSSGAASPSNRIPFVLLYAAVTCSGIAVLTGRAKA